MTMVQDLLPTVTSADNVPGPAQGQWTAKDYPNLPDDGQAYEIMNGVLMKLPSPDSLHQQTLHRLSSYVVPHTRTTRLGHAYSDPIYLELAPDVVVRPDLFIDMHADHKQHSRETEKQLIGTPELIIEVTSPGSSRYDWRDKYDAYARAGVWEYWIVHPEAKAVEVLVLENGEFRSSGVFEGQAAIRSRVLRLFDLPAENFFI